jgi:hypothetical protein
MASLDLLDLMQLRLVMGVLGGPLASQILKLNWRLQLP